MTGGTGKDFKGNVCDLIDVLPRNLLVGTDEKHEKSQSE
jgi:hypothetical protein